MTDGTDESNQMKQFLPLFATWGTTSLSFASSLVSCNQIVSHLFPYDICLVTKTLKQDMNWLRGSLHHHFRTAHQFPKFIWLFSGNRSPFLFLVTSISLLVLTFIVNKCAITQHKWWGRASLKPCCRYSKSWWIVLYAVGLKEKPSMFFSPCLQNVRLWWFLKLLLL